MTAAAVLLELEASGVSVTYDGKLRLKRGGPIAPELLARAVAHRDALVDLLSRGREFVVPHDPHDPQRPNILPRATSTGGGKEDRARGTGGSCGTGSSRLEPVAVDFETRSLASLPAVGGCNYAMHPSTEVLCAVFALPDGDIIEWRPPEPLDPRVCELVASGTPVMAHNAHGFDRFIWNRLDWPAVTWIDTMSLARVLGLPASLEDLGETLLDVKKDLEGRGLVLALGRPDRLGRLPPVTTSDLDRVVRYCRLDVLILRGIFDHRLHRATSIEPAVRDLDVVVNERGFGFDAELARAVIACEEIAAGAARAEAGVDNATLSSPRRLKRVLAEAGYGVANVRRDTLLELLEDAELPADVQRIISARLASAGINGHKLRAGLRRLGPDGRLRDALSYAAAHTGRWAGRGFQPQNLPRGAKGLSTAQLADAVGAALSHDVDHLRSLGAAAGAGLHEVLASLVRACIVASEGRLLGVADYAAIEARALLWLAGDSKGLEQFSVSGWDPYKAMAARLFGVDVKDIADDDVRRSLGKALILGCGYAMGYARFELYAETYGVDWSKLDLNAQDAVEAWRDAHPLVAGERGAWGRTDGLWKGVEQTAIDTVATGVENGLGWGGWLRDGRDLVCQLPSGRPLFYREPRLERVMTPWKKEQWVLTYEHRGQRVRAYGGKLVENITQAMCRDLLADAMLRLTAANISIVLHVHDEVVADLATTAEFDAMKKTMTLPPSWAPGLPLKVTGYIATRYRK